MTDTIELIDKAEVRDGQAIVKYSRTEHALAILREKYKDAKYDLTTTAGDKAARAARLELKTLRTDLEKKRTELKAPALLFGKTIDSEAARLTAEIQALETPIDAQIKADEKRREDERIAAELTEAADALEVGRGEPVAWRVRGHAFDFNTDEPRLWHYYTGSRRPTVGVPYRCDIEPLYAAPAAQVAQEGDAGVLGTKGGDDGR